MNGYATKLVDNYCKSPSLYPGGVIEIIALLEEHKKKVIREIEWR